MKKIITTIAIAATVMGVFAQGKLPAGYKAPKVVTEADSVSMYLGMDVGRNVHALGFDIDFDSFMYGFILSATDRDIDISPAVEYLREYFTVRVPARENVRTTEWLDELLATRPGLIRTESGLVFEIVSPGDMAYRATDDEDSVEVAYTGTLRDGTEFDSIEGAVFRLDRVIPGLTEGLKLVGKGGRIKLYIHPELGYGSRSQGAGVPANSLLIFDIEVLDAPEVL